jgi:hypothetical protein
VHQIFTRIRSRLEGARRELRALEEAVGREPPGADETTHWMRRSATAFAVTAIYTGIESILKVIADDVDRHLPSGSDWHAELLLAMSLEVPGTRPAVLSLETKRLLDELRKFRHAARNNYPLDLTDEGVFANLERLRRAMPLVERDLVAFEAAMTGSTSSEG